MPVPNMKNKKWHTLQTKTTVRVYEQLYLYQYHDDDTVAQWFRCCATNGKITGSIPASVIGFFVDIIFFRSHYGPGVDSASNRNEYQEYFLGVKEAGA